MASATPGSANASPAALAAATLNIILNEWMAEPASGPDWFEFYNTNSLPVELSGLLVTDDLSLAGINKSRIGPLSFVAGRGWVRFVADSDPAAGRNHVNFNLASGGEAIRLYTAASNIIATFYFGAQAAGISQGRLPDGGAQIASFPGSASPAESNYLLPENVVINEVLTHTTSPLQDAVELYNPSSGPAAIGGWYLSDDVADLKKFRVTDGTVIDPGSYLVLYENQFNAGSKAFGLNRSRGNVLWLSQADAGGTLTGVRAWAEYGAALNGVSMGRFVTRTVNEFVALSQRTLGAANAYPRIGPVVISEIMYHPPDIVTPTNVINNTDDEFIELQNTSGAAVSLGSWRLDGGVDFIFGPAATLPASGYVLVVSFDPVVNTAALNAFRANYGLAPTVPIFGPYQGRLNNDSETIALYQPDVPEGGFVPSVLVERVNYSDTAPWPAGDTDGGGLSMQRRAPVQFGNDPLSWMAADPSPGAPNNSPIVPLPIIAAQPQSQTLFAGNAGALSVSASGGPPLWYQWRFNGVNIPGATNATLAFMPVVLEDDGNYDVYVSSASGSAFSDSARLSVAAPPAIFVAPQTFIVRPGTNVTFSVTAAGPGPITYQWRYAGVDIPGAT
ncbi:MAG: lamin tail domain-containing protein, partial [Phycisphaerales bacterium]|nr:lamin tail domain-containing protein [Phycisphaerales bacterium]